MNCCDLKTDQAFCPNCQQPGELIEQKTLHSLLKDEFISLLRPEEKYSYCSNFNCDVVYHTKNRIFKAQDLSVLVFHKDQSLDVPVCYCFNITRRAILNDVKSEGRTSVINEIMAKMKKPGCFCEQSNPQGRCCLSNVEAYIKELLK